MQPKEAHGLWVVLKQKQRVVTQLVIPLGLEDPLEDPLTRACHQLDLERPVVLPKHYRDMEEFGRTVFLGADFMDAFLYDRLELIHLTEEG